MSVGWATADGTATAPADYTAASGKLVFNPGVTTRAGPVQVNGDTLDEIDETFDVRLSKPDERNDSRDGIGLGTITDDDPLPGLSVNDVTVAEGNSGTVAATFTVSLTVSSGREVTVGYATADGSAAAGATTYRRVGSSSRPGRRRRRSR